MSKLKLHVHYVHMYVLILRFPSKLFKNDVEHTADRLYANKSRTRTSGIYGTSSNFATQTKAAASDMNRWAFKKKAHLSRRLLIAMREQSPNKQTTQLVSHIVHNFGVRCV